MGNLYTSTTFMEHSSHPDYKYEMAAPTHTHDGINPSCGDELTLSLRVEDGVVEEAKRLSALFLAMIRGEELTEDDFEDLDEAAQLKDISHMPARVKCAELAWRTLDGMLAE